MLDTHFIRLTTCERLTLVTYQRQLTISGQESHNVVIEVRTR